MSKSATQTAQPAAKPFSPAQGILQRKCECGNHTLAGGQCAECGKEKNNLQRKAELSALGAGFSLPHIPVIQPKLAIGASNDPLEAEAERIADQVLAKPTDTLVSEAPPRIQRYAGPAAGQAADTAPDSVDRVLAGSGRPLEPALQKDMEQRFGHDFSRVRVHSGALAEQSARDVNATAYTAGHNIVFGASRFAPGTHEGRWLIAHELTHVVQQSAADGICVRQGAPSSDAPRLGAGFAGAPSVSQLVHRRAPWLARQMVTRNLQDLSDRELQAEHGRVREWLSLHAAVEFDYQPTLQYFASIEAEVARRDPRSVQPAVPGIQTRPPAGANIQVPPGAPRLSAPPPPGTLFSGPRRPASDAPLPMTASHAGGALGERELPFALGEEGIHLVATSVGPGAHPLTGHGFDAIGWNPATRELWLIDNKSTGQLGKLEGNKATALGVNLESSLAEAVTKVRGMPEFADKSEVLNKLEKAWDSVRAGKDIPTALNVKLKLTNAGGYGGGAGVGARNLPAGTTAEDLVSPRVRQARGEDIAAAKVNDANPARPRSHEDTEAMRSKVGGVQSRQPMVPTLRQKIVIGVKSAGVTVVKHVALLAWNYMMTKVEQKIEAAVSQWILQDKLLALEPLIAARLDDQVRILANVQVSNPGKPLYGNVSVQITAYRHGDEDGDEVLMNLTVALTDVSIASIAAEPRRGKTERHWTGVKYVAYQPYDVTPWTYQIELEPLSSEALRAILGERISELEEAEAARSAEPTQVKASSQERNRLAEQLRTLEAR